MPYSSALPFSLEDPSRANMSVERTHGTHALNCFSSVCLRPQNGRLPKNNTWVSGLNDIDPGICKSRHLTPTYPNLSWIIPKSIPARGDTMIPGPGYPDLPRVSVFQMSRAAASRES